MATATFAAGCFWGVEVAFRQVPGVRDAKAGYTGGTTPNPNYQEVCTGRTGHAEAVQVDYDPAQVDYATLLATFWACHDPTQMNRQGPDIGTQYRSAVFYHDEAQRQAAEADKARMRADGRAVVTEIVPAATFWPAEEYHQRYLEKRGVASCRIG